VGWAGARVSGIRRPRARAPPSGGPAGLVARYGFHAASKRCYALHRAHSFLLDTGTRLPPLPRVLLNPKWLKVQPGALGAQPDFLQVPCVLRKQGRFPENLVVK